MESQAFILNFIDVYALWLLFLQNCGNVGARELLTVVLTFLEQGIDMFLLCGRQASFGPYLKTKKVKRTVCAVLLDSLLKSYFSFPTATWKKRHSGNIRSLGRGNVLQEVCVKLKLCYQHQLEFVQELDLIDLLVDANHLGKPSLANTADFNGV